MTASITTGSDILEDGRICEWNFIIELKNGNRQEEKNEQGREIQQGEGFVFDGSEDIVKECVNE